MNRPIVRLYGVIAILFALLVAFTSRWTIFDASSLRANKYNRRAELAQQRIARGEILAANGQVLAKSVRSSGGTYRRVYPTGSLFSDVLGYSFVNAGSRGLEAYRSEALSGQPATGIRRLLDQLEGSSASGQTVQTTLVPRVQEAAVSALAGRDGAVVAIEPKSGDVEAMASSPGYDPNKMATSAGAAQLNKASGSPLVNRALQYGYAPGSTFKVVTLTAALDSGAFTPLSRLSGRDGLIVSGVPLHNDQDETFGDITLTEALAQSVNTVYAQVAEKLGKATMARYMSRFGFDAKPQLDYPDDEMEASGEYFKGQLTPPRSELVDVGRMGIGQDQLHVTPLQMAEVAAAVANHGRLMAPHLTARIIGSDGDTVEREAPKVQSVVMKPSTAAEVTEMMEAVVREGTGTAAQIPGVDVAGKTGTAETVLGQSVNNAWFIAFAPASNPRVAVAATLAKVPGYGATFALPVAKQVIEAVLR